MKIKLLFYSLIALFLVVACDEDDTMNWANYFGDNGNTTLTLQ